ncbi:MAG: hypothetical protein ACPGWR_23480 [Ardenticatenaceae bacterium]
MPTPKKYLLRHLFTTPDSIPRVMIAPARYTETVTNGADLVILRDYVLCPIISLEPGRFPPGTRGIAPTFSRL